MNTTEPLPRESVERLIPVLRPLAQLVAINGRVGNDELALLSLGLGIEEPDLEWASPELRRWASVLVVARQGTAQQAAVGALTLRGIPEASAQLAVSAAAEAVAAATAEAAPIWVSSQTISVGELSPGTEGRAELVVRGGPGTAKSRTDAISVEPGSFGPGETTLQIRIAPATAGRILWDTLELESATNRLLVDVTARWREVPTLIVSPTGSAQHRTIGSALAAATRGTRILICAGLYQEGVVLDKQVELVGDGPADEIVIEADASSCITMRAERALVCGVTLRGRAGAERGFFGVDIANGSLILENCDITSNSTCVAIHGSKTAPILRDCRIHDSRGSGVLIYEQGRGTLEGCDIFANAYAGVAIVQGAAPTLRDCLIYDGQRPGVYVDETGRGTLENCEIFDNGFADVDKQLGADLTVRDCDIKVEHGLGWVIQARDPARDEARRARAASRRRRRL